MRKFVFGYLCILYLLSNHLIQAQSEMPSREDRMYSLSVIWKEMQYNFAFPEVFREVNPDSLYRVYLPKVEQAADNYEYFRLLNEYMNHFNEAHTRVYASNRPDDTLPLEAINFGEKVVVGNVAEKMADKLPVGSEIVKINDIPVAAFIRDSVAPYIPAATAHWKFDKSVIELFYGRPGSVVKITAKTPEGKESEVEMIRNFHTNGSNEPMVDSTPYTPIEIKILEGNIGYIHLKSFQGQYLDTIHTVFIEHLPQLREAKGLIIDIRGNRGGTDIAWYYITYHLLPGTHFSTAGKWFTRKYIPTYRIWGQSNPDFREYYEGTAMEEIEHAESLINVADSLRFRQPLMVLSGRHVASAAEDFLVLMKETGRATIVGGASVGCMGEPMFIPLPGEYGVMICSKKYVSPEGIQHNKTGILPDITVEESYEAYLEGRDNVLEGAIEELTF